jgi:myo-inositol-1(or 4)-monophosphatase
VAPGPPAASRFAADAAFAREIAERAGRLLFERYERVEEIDYKSARDVVTEVDHLSEALILGAIRERYPSDGILAEESGAHHGSGASGGAGAGGGGAVGGGGALDHPPAAGPGGATAADAVSRALVSGRTWIVDPLDGTINYANGIPYFCVSVGLVVDGRPAAGAVCDPMRGETYWATVDGPAMLGDRVVHASAKDKLTDCVISLSLGGRAVATRGRAVRRAVRASRNTGSAALALAYVANGRFDAFLQSGGMSAWDVAAAGLIAERGGAVVTDDHGGSWFDVDKATRAFGIVAAPATHHSELLRLSREGSGS